MSFKRVLIVLILAIIVSPWLIWYFMPSEELDVAILNKTMPGALLEEDELDYQEHQGITWILNYLKYTREDGDRYRSEADFFGTIPEKEGESVNYRPLPGDLEDKDLIYIADTYGTEELDEHQGLSQKELEKIRRAAYSGTDIISEFNTFANPTPPDIRDYMQEVLGVRWTGWIGRHFNDLSAKTEIPETVPDTYQEQYDREYNYEGPGIVLLNEAKAKVVILDQGKVKGQGQGIEMSFTSRGEEILELDRSKDYSGWFDIVEPIRDTESLANFDLNVSGKGEELLAEHELPISFPAISKYTNSIYNSYYFSGNFSNVTSTPFHNISGLPRLLSSLGGLLMDARDEFYWQAFVPIMSTILDDIHLAMDDEPYKAKKEEHVLEEDEVKLFSRTDDSHMEIHTGEAWEELFIKGINLGIAEPGKWFTEFPDKESTYLDWFEKIGDMNVNSLRVYTLMDPSFYRALLKYNLDNLEDPLWLFQNIWPEEHPQDNNLLDEDYMEDFKQEIEYAVDAIHGEGSIPERPGRAYGEYYADVSPFTISFLTGREIETYEVMDTNELNDDTTSYEGDYLTVETGSPVEVWLAKAIDYTMEYEAREYSWQRPNAFVSWPILDPIDHTEEYAEFVGDEGIYNDEASIDIRNFSEGDKLKTGFYGSYHIYPNYPGFINHNLRYEEYTDEEGTFRYGGYLEHFMEKHQGYPALVAEFGQATGMGKAHESPDGYHHGGLSEEEQGEGIIRMMEAIEAENYMGGIIFEWMDEWAKKTWTTEPFMIPYEHNVFWHNTIDPEQNYGILANEGIKPEKPHYEMSSDDLGRNEKGFKNVSFSGNESYLYLDLELESGLDLDEKDLLLGIDTYERDKGQFKYNYQDEEIEFETGKEFLVKIIDKEEAKLLVTPDYNAFESNYSTAVKRTGEFQEINPLINARMVRKDGTVIEEVKEDGSALDYGELEGSTNHWYKEKSNKISLRIPWTRLNVTDPTDHKVLDDTREINYQTLERDQLHTTQTEGFVISRYLFNESGSVHDFTTEPFLWETWGEPRYNQRLKESYYILQEYWEE